MDSARLDRALVVAAEIEHGARYEFETNADPSERKAAQDVMRGATALRLAVGRWIEARLVTRGTLQ